MESLPSMLPPIFTGPIAPPLRITPLKLLGPPKSEHLLEGIRIELLRELCEECGIAYNLRPITEADVRTADEVLLSSATKEVLPVTRIDGEEVGHGAMRGKPGPVYSRLHEAYQAAKLTMSI